VKLPSLASLFIPQALYCNGFSDSQIEQETKNADIKTIRNNLNIVIYNTQTIRV